MCRTRRPTCPTGSRAFRASSSCPCPCRCPCHRRGPWPCRRRPPCLRHSQPVRRSAARWRWAPRWLPGSAVRRRQPRGRAADRSTPSATSAARPSGDHESTDRHGRWAGAGASNAGHDGRDDSGRLRGCCGPDCRPDSRRKRSHIREAVGRVDRQAAPNRLGKLRFDVRKHGRRDGLGLRDRHWRRSVERRAAGQHLAGDRGQAVLVARGRRRLPAELLGRHVAQRPHHEPGSRSPRSLIRRASPRRPAGRPRSP